jgi:DegV family protein with EDD domain
VARRLLLVLLGKELGVAADVSLEALVGDLAQKPFVELIHDLAGAGFTGELDLRHGRITLIEGRVAAASAGPARGVKAFCRLGRLHEGSFRIVRGVRSPEREIFEDLDVLLSAAIEDSLGELPDPRHRLSVEMGPAFFASTFTPLGQLVLAVAQRGAAVQEVLDALPERDGAIVNQILALERRGVLKRRAPGVLIVTDSTSDLPPELAQRHGISVVPLPVAFGTETFRDRVDLQPGRFYQLLETRKEHPVSSPAPKSEFDVRFRQAVQRGQEIVAVLISGKLSKTVEHARAALAEAVPTSGPGHAAVIDSRQVSSPLGLLALFAARMAARGLEAREIEQRILQMTGRTHCLFVVDTLEYLARGGRIGRARALLGGILGIKPILGIVDGEVAPVDRVRGGRAAHPRLVELHAQRVDPQRPVVVGLSHGNAPVWADRLEALLRQRFQVSELIEAEVGPVVGTHAGPGVVSAAAFQPEGDEAELIAPLEAHSQKRT